MATVVKRLATLALAMSAGAASSADCPEPKCYYMPITVVVPFGAGGAVDRVARLLAPELSKAFSQTIIVDNKPGAAGSIGMQAAARAAPDSHTLLLSNQGPIAVTPHLLKNVPVDPLKDLVPSAEVAINPQVLVVRADSPFRDLKALLQKPNGATYGTGGAGSLGHLLGSILAGSPNARLTHVPYRGTGPAMQGVLGGQTDAAILDMGSADLRSGRYRPLAVTGQRRSATAPDVPTFAELGFSGLESGWIGAFFPAGTHAAVVSRLNTEVQKILRNPEFRQALQAAGMEPGTLNTAAFGSLVREDSQRWAQVVRRYDIKTD